MHNRVVDMRSAAKRLATLCFDWSWGRLPHTKASRAALTLCFAVPMQSALAQSPVAQSSEGAKFIKNTEARSGFKTATRPGQQIIGMRGGYRFDAEASKWHLQSYEPGVQALYSLEDSARAALWSVRVAEGTAKAMTTEDADKFVADHALEKSPYGRRSLVDDWVRTVTAVSKRPTQYRFLAKTDDADKWAVTLNVKYQDFDILFAETSFALSQEQSLAALEDRQARLHQTFAQDLTVSIPIKVTR